MRFLAVVFLAGLCAAQIHRPPVSYSEGQEYVYKYKGRLLTGLPELAAHYAGMGIHCNVHLAVAPGSIKTYHIRVTDAKFAKVNGKVEPKEGSSGIEETFSWRQVDIKHYMAVPASAAAALASPVVFSVSRESGELESLRLSESHESEWSVNFKKALVVLFKTQGIPAIPSENRISSSEMVPAWETMEESLEGYCKVDYQMRELPKYLMKDRPDLVKFEDLRSAGICQHESVKFYEIVRSRDLSSCTRRFAFTFYKPGRMRCSTEDSSAGASPNCEGMMSKSSVTRYIACGSSVDSLTTATILNEGETAMALLGIKAEKFLSGAKQTLRLVRKSEASSISLSSPSGSPKELKSLHFEYKLKKTSEMGGETVGIDLEEGGKGSLVSQETELLPRHLIARGYSEDEAVRSGGKVEHVIGLIKDMINEMVHEDFEHTANLPAKEVTMKALGVASGLSMLTKEQIIDVYHSLKHEMEQEGEKMKKTFTNIFIDTLMMSGTRAAILFLEEKMHELDQYTLISAFSFLPTYLMVPKVPTLEVMLRMVESEPLSHMPLAKSQAVMAAALLTQRACIAGNKDTSYPVSVYGEFCHPESPFVIGRIIPFLQRKLESATSSEERNLYLVALGIIGHRDVVPAVLPYLEKNKPVESKDAEAREEKELEESKMSRFLALYSLVKTGEYYPGSVEAIIFSIIANPAESSDLRVAAINSLIRLNPSEVYFHRLAALTLSDKDTKVIETINTALYTLSVNRNYEPLATVKTSAPHKAWLVYPLTNKITFRGGSKIPFAGTFVMGDKLERLNTGFYDVTSYFMSDKSFVPLDFYYRTVNLMNRYEVTPLEFGGRIKGFENLAQQLIELVTPAGVQNESRESFAAKVKANLTPELKSIIEQLGLEHSRIESESSHKSELATIFSAFETTPLFRSLKSESASELLHKIGKIFGEPHISKSELKEMICKEHPINIQRLVDFAPSEWAIPSEMGFPILMEVHAPAVAAMRGHIKIECEGMVPKVTVKAKTNLANQLVGFIGTVIPFTSEFALATVDVHSVMGAPVIIETELKPIEHKLTIKVKADEDFHSIDKVDIFHYHIRPFTTVTKIGDIRPAVLEGKIKAIKSKGSEKNIHSSRSFQEMTGLHASLKTESAFVDLRGVYEKLRLFNMNPINTLRFWWASVGLSETQKPSLRSHEYKLKYQPLSSGPKEMRMDIKLDSAYLAKGSNEVMYRSVKLIESESEKGSTWPEWKKVLPLKVEDMPISRVPSIHSDKARKAEEMIKQKLGTGIKEGKAIILTLHMVLSNGVSRPMTYASEIIYGTGMTSLKSKWNIVMGSLTDSYKMCIKGEMDVPSRMAAFDIEQLRSTPVSMDFETEIGMGWHGNCDSSKIKIIGVTKRSEEQKEWSRISPEAKQLEKLRRINSPIKETSTVANAVRRQASSMDELKFTFKYERVSPQVLKVTEMVSEYVQASLWPYYIVGSTSSSSSGISDEPTMSETTEWRLKFSYHTPTFNMTVAVPRGEGQAMGNVHKFAHVRMPKALSYLMDYPLSAADLVAKQVQGSSKMIGSFPTCAIEETDFIRTYANATYKLKLDNCFHLAVADNSYNRQFAVLVKEISPAKKVAKVIIEGKTTVEIKGDLSNPIVKVNGINLPIQDNEKKPILDRSRKQVADIIRYSDNTLSLQAVYSPLLAGGAALIVKIQGGKLLLETSPAIFPEGVIGLCGSPSAAKLMAPAGPTSCYYSHPKVLAASYRLPELEGSSCPPLPEIVATKLREENAKCTKAKVLPTKVFKSYNSLMNGSGSEQIPCTRHVHEMFERSTEICFSRRPVTKCSAACRPASGALIEKSVSFGCISKERRVAELYAAKVRRGQILPELASLPERFSASTQLPRSCIRI